MKKVYIFFGVANNDWITFSILIFFILYVLEIKCSGQDTRDRGVGSGARKWGWDCEM